MNGTAEIVNIVEMPGYQAIIDRWKIHREDGIALRHATGLWLNKLVAGETEFGKQTIALFCLSSGMHPSDFSRARSFAAQHPSLEEFRKKHPTVRTWSELKGMLSAGGKAKKSPSNATRKRERCLDLVRIVRKLKREFETGMDPQDAFEVGLNLEVDALFDVVDKAFSSQTGAQKGRSRRRLQNAR